MRNVIPLASREIASNEVSGDGSRSSESQAEPKSVISLRNEIRRELTRFRETLSFYDNRFTQLTSAYRNMTRRLHRFEQQLSRGHLQQLQPSNDAPPAGAVTSQLLNITSQLMEMQQNLVQMQLQSSHSVTSANDVTSNFNTTTNRLERLERAREEEEERREEDEGRRDAEVLLLREKTNDIQQTMLRQVEKIADLQVSDIIN